MKAKASILVALNEPLVVAEVGLPSEFVERLLNSGDHPLKCWREYRRLTQQALAEQVGVRKSYISAPFTRHPSLVTCH